MPAKSTPIWKEIPRRAALRTRPTLPAKIPWDGTIYDKPADVLPWLQTALREAMAANPTWSKTGIPVGYEGPFFEVDNLAGNFKVVGPSATHPPYITWYSPWTNTRWSMYLETVSVRYKGTRPVKNN